MEISALSCTSASTAFGYFAWYSATKRASSRSKLARLSAYIISLSERLSACAADQYVALMNHTGCAPMNLDASTSAAMFAADCANELKPMLKKRRMEILATAGRPRNAIGIPNEAGEGHAVAGHFRKITGRQPGCERPNGCRSQREMNHRNTDAHSSRITVSRQARDQVPENRPPRPGSVQQRTRSQNGDPHAPAARTEPSTPNDGVELGANVLEVRTFAPIERASASSNPCSSSGVSAGTASSDSNHVPAFRQLPQLIRKSLPFHLSTVAMHHNHTRGPGGSRPAHRCPVTGRVES